MRQLRRNLLCSAALAGAVALGACGVSVQSCLVAPCEGDFPDDDRPAATVKPSALTVAVGADATFTVETPGLSMPSFQWYRTPRGGSQQHIPGATGASYTLVGAQAADDGATFKAQVDATYRSERFVQFSSEGMLTVR